jgi:sugar O-acyltransferase (sialic acid O-acetyltransferase NeuD family)
MNSKRLYILGTGWLAQEFFALATDAKVSIESFVENEDPEKVGNLLCGRPIIWIDKLPPDAECICAISSNSRQRFIHQVEGKAKFGCLIHPSSVILPNTSIGEGTIISTGALIASNTTIGSHVFINRGVQIGHHTKIADYVRIMPGANIAGLVVIGETTYVGMGAIILERIKIGKEVTIAAGAVVIRDLPDNVLVAGNPAVIKKRGVDVK